MVAASEDDRSLQVPYFSQTEYNSESTHSVLVPPISQVSATFLLF